MSSSTQVIDEGAVHSDSALAAYATLEKGWIDPLLLQAQGMTEAQAIAFSENNTVVAQAELFAGASATVFQDAEGKIYLSIRGTEPLDLRDLVGDTLMGFGIPVGANPQYWGLNSQVAEWISDGTLPQQFEVDGHSAGGYYGVALKAMMKPRTHAGRDCPLRLSGRQAYVSQFTCCRKNGWLGQGYGCSRPSGWGPRIAARLS